MSDINHTHKSIEDKIWMIAEMEHLRRHAIRKGVLIERLLKDEQDPKKKDTLTSQQMGADVLAFNLTTLRRRFMEREFPDVEDYDWCIIKAAACLRQLCYECCDDEGIREGVDFIFERALWDATGEDFSDCKSCQEDRKEGE